MNKSIGLFVACLFGVVACNVEHYEDCGFDTVEPDDGFGDFGGSHGYAGSKAKGGSSSANGGAAATTAGNATGATAGSGASASGGSAPNAAGGGNDGEGGDATVVVPPTPCEKEHDCGPGYNCDLELHQCLPAAEETCPELDTELACTHRSDCTPIYGGTNCSCGQDCECHGGEPGCICENFGFVVCK